MGRMGGRQQNEQQNRRDSAGMPPCCRGLHKSHP